MDKLRLKMLQELDSKTDWEAVIKQKNMLNKSADKVQKAKDSSVKLTKSQKKRLKLEKQQQEVQELLKGKDIETVVYSNPDSISAKLNKQIAREQAAAGTDTIADIPGIDIDMRKTRFEIMKFGMDSLKSKDLDDAETALAISLGARPNKRPSINYKDLQIQRKKERDLEKEEASTSMKPKLKFIPKKKPQGTSGGKRSKRDDSKKQTGVRPASRPRSRNKK